MRGMILILILAVVLAACGQAPVATQPAITAPPEHPTGTESTIHNPQFR